MQKEQRKSLFARFLSGRATKKEKDQVYSMPESERMMKALWNKHLTHTMQDETRAKILNNIYLKTTRQPRIIRLLPLIRVAAVLLIGLIIGGVIFSDDLFNKHSNTLVSMQSPAGQRTTISLPDGTKVVLAGSSQIEYPEAFNDKSREVKLIGQAYFDVTHLNAVPFYVTTSDIRVSVLGTQFSVSSYPGDPVIQTILLTGKVQITCYDKNKSVDLLPGEQHTYNSISKSGSVSKVDAPRLMEWIDGKMLIDQEDIYAVCKKLERWYGVDIEISNHRNITDLYTFTIDNNTLSEVLLLMQKVSPLQYSFDENHLTLTFSE